MNKQILEENNVMREAYCLSMFAVQALSNALETEIGDIKDIGRDTVTVVGYQKKVYENPISIMRIGKYPLEKKKFNLDNIESTIKDNAEAIGLSDKYVDEVVKRLTDFDSNKTVIVPFQENTPIKIFHEYTPGMKQKIDAEVSGVEYVMNRDTLKYEYKLNIKAVSPAYSVDKPITDFGRSMFDEIYDNANKINIGTQPAVQFSRFGYVKTIRIISGHTNYIVDNCFVYAEEGNGENKKLTILGRLINGGIDTEPEVDITKYQKDRGFSSLIEKSYCIVPYLKFIVPYGLGEINDIVR